MKPLVSYVFPIYNEEGNIDLLYRTMCEVTERVSDRYRTEFIFVNDGSRDSSLERLARLHDDDPRVVVVDLARNFGHQVAVTAGMDIAQGDAVIVMDSDMQDPPEVSLEMLTKWEEGFEVVYAQRRTRKDSPFKRFTAFAFYRTLDRLTDISIPKDTGDFRLMDRKVVDAMKSMRERNRFLRGLSSYAGYRQAAVPFDRAGRHAGETAYPLRKMIALALDGITGFSTVPLRLISQLGFLVSALAFAGIGYALVMKVFFPEITVPGWTLMIIAILAIGGMQMMTLGVVGMYVGRIYTEVQSRPLYFVSAVYSAGKPEPSDPREQQFADAAEPVLLRQFVR